MNFSLLLGNKQAVHEICLQKHAINNLLNTFDHEFENSDPHLNFSVDNNFLPLGNSTRTYEDNSSLNLLPSVNAMHTLSLIHI